MTTAQNKADELWAKMDQNERTCVRIGIFPLWVREHETDEADGRELALALIDCAKADGGMHV